MQAQHWNQPPTLQSASTREKVKASNVIHAMPKNT